MSLFNQTLDWYLINNSITEIPAHEGSLLLMLSAAPRYSMGMHIFLEPLGAVQVFGIILTLAGIIVYQFFTAPETGRTIFAALTGISLQAKGDQFAAYTLPTFSGLN